MDIRAETGLSARLTLLKNELRDPAEEYRYLSSKDAKT